MAREQRTRLGLIGYGAIAREIVRCAGANPNIDLVGALVLADELDKPASFPLVASLDAFLALGPGLVAECASHEAVDAYAEPILMAGLDLLIVSIGALADAAREVRVRQAASRATGQLLLPAGALIGLDGLSAARHAGLDEVRLTSRKPPLSWAGAPGVVGRDLAAIKEETVVFEGSARQAALQFPKNANVAATAALAGIGFERTRVTLIADPATQRNKHTLEFSGRAGHYRVETDGVASPDNPKTSMLTAYAIFRAIEARSSPVTI